MAQSVEPATTLRPRRLLGGLREDGAAAPIEGATWYVASDVGDGLEYAVPEGRLAAAQYLVADLLVDGVDLAAFRLVLREGAGGPAFVLTFAALNQCTARMRTPLAAVDLNRWMLRREGAWLKPLCGGDRVDPARVDRLELTLLRKGPAPVRWCLTPISVALTEPPRLDDTTCVNGPLLDALGQSRQRSWAGRTADEAELVTNLRAQHAAAGDQQWPAGFSRWGGWTEQPLEATGYFRTHHDGRRWWLVDPDGHRYWSAGANCVRSSIEAAYGGLASALEWLPPSGGDFDDAVDEERTTANYLAANLIRAFGPDSWHDHWETLALAMLRRAGFTTVANWSEWQPASRHRFPYVRPLNLRFPRTPMVYRDFPDVFDPAFDEDVAEFAQRSLSVTRDDPALVGYFLGNEPTWGFSEETPAAGMLATTRGGATRRALADFLRQRYGDDAGLAAAWGAEPVPGTEVSLARVAEGRWEHPLAERQLPERARADLEEFSTVMVARLFGRLSAACHEVDPHHLNLGARYQRVPPAWALAGMTDFDVFSVNSYRERVPSAELAALSAQVGRPVVVGEWHFGALDVGLPASGIGHVRTQADRARAFRVYTEDAAAQPWCVGVHYFTLYDQSALGRFDGENYNIGFVDVCHRPYEPLVTGARESHSRMYRVASGELPPYDDAPEYLPRLFA